MVFVRILMSISAVLAVSARVRADVGDAHVATWRHNAQAAYTLTYDDNMPDQLNYIAPALGERGLRGTFFVNPALASFHRLGSGYAQLALDGHELGSHTLTHQSVIVNDPAWPTSCMESLEELEEDCIESKALLDALVPGAKTVSFCYPYGREDADSRGVVANYFLSARAVHTYTNYPSGHYQPNPATPPDMFSLGCFLTSGTGNAGVPSFRHYATAASTFAAYISDTLAAGGWAIEYRHNLWGENQAAYWEHLDELQILGEQGILWNAPQGEVAKYIYSRDATDITLIAATAESLALAVDDSLDDEIYDIPVTVNVRIPADWAETELTIFHGHRPLEGRTYWESDAAFVAFDVLADGARITISPVLPTVPEPGTVLLLGGLALGVGARRLRRRPA